ncbi:hypothetical protein ZIOFF_045720 [Zingiber officinale]|uniref:Cytochrome P450 n=2 Tax=Zingiber officinale TaxID=94328 RepID=A0A8J5KVI9_ZINOF|nr:hypothetical protein ZIOFF_045720 [Zingiber officinale]
MMTATNEAGVATSDGKMIDQGIAYLLMMVALLTTLWGMERTLLTTLWGMEWTLAELVKHSRCYKPFPEELQRVLAEEPETETSMPPLLYLQAVVKEMLSMHSPIPLLVPQMNLDAAKFGWYEIPKQTKVIVNAW